MFSWIQKLFNKPKRLELRYVTWTEAGRLLHEGWTVAKEEDYNHRLGWIYLERLEKIN